MNLRDVVVDYAESSGLLATCTVDTTYAEVYTGLEDKGLGAALVLEAGLPPEAALWYERVGAVIPFHVYNHWRDTGEFVMRHRPNNETAKLYSNTLCDIINTFGVRPYLDQSDIESQSHEIDCRPFTEAHESPANKTAPLPDGIRVPAIFLYTDVLVLMPDGSRVVYADGMELEMYGLLSVRENRRDEWPDDGAHPAVALGLSMDEWEQQRDAIARKVRRTVETKRDKLQISGATLASLMGTLEKIK
jgi:hypothetical protein